MRSIRSQPLHLTNDISKNTALQGILVLLSIVLCIVSDVSTSMSCGPEIASLRILAEAREFFEKRH